MRLRRTVGVTLSFSRCCVCTRTRRISKGRFSDPLIRSCNVLTPARRLPPGHLGLITCTYRDHGNVHVLAAPRHAEFELDLLQAVKLSCWPLPPSYVLLLRSAQLCYVFFCPGYLATLRAGRLLTAGRNCVWDRSCLCMPTSAATRETSVVGPGGSSEQMISRKSGKSAMPCNATRNDNWG